MDAVKLPNCFAPQSGQMHAFVIRHYLAQPRQLVQMQPLDPRQQRQQMPLLVLGERAGGVALLEVGQLGAVLV